MPNPIITTQTTSNPIATPQTKPHPNSTTTDTQTMEPKENGNRSEGVEEDEHGELEERTVREI